MTTRPLPWSAYTTPEFWADEHISAQMLAAHLDPTWEAASRRHDVIDRASAWLAGTLGVDAGTRVLDLGCGPGLYAVRLARAGAAVTGLDISPRSVAHATATAADEGLDCRFAVANYLTDDLGGPFDAVLFSFEDVCVLSPGQRASLFAKIAAALAPGGRLAMDVTSAARFGSVVEGTRSGAGLDRGFWAPSPYEATTETWTYPEERLVLERTTVTRADGTRQFWNWMACLTPEEVRPELIAAGFAGVDVVGDLTGAPYDDAAPSFAVVATR